MLHHISTTNKCSAVVVLSCRVKLNENVTGQIRQTFTWLHHTLCFAVTQLALSKCIITVQFLHLTSDTSDLLFASHLRAHTVGDTSSPNAAMARYSMMNPIGSTASYRCQRRSFRESRTPYVTKDITMLRRKTGFTAFGQWTKSKFIFVCLSASSGRIGTIRLRPLQMMGCNFKMLLKNKL